MKGKPDQGPQRAEINYESQQVNNYIVNSSMHRLIFTRTHKKSGKYTAFFLKAPPNPPKVKVKTKPRGMKPTKFKTISSIPLLSNLNPFHGEERNSFLNIGICDGILR
jgi:hypothetical protein